MVRVRQPGLLLGEWACLGALGQGRLHGFAIAKRLSADGDIGRVWTLSRPLTYRALSTLTDLGMVRAVGEEPGDAGPNRMVLALTPKGRAALRGWLVQPVTHARDVRSELLVKIVVSQLMEVDTTVLIDRQLEVFDRQRRDREEERQDELAAQDGHAADPVKLWRLEFAEAAVRFLEVLRSQHNSP